VAQITERGYPVAEVSQQLGVSQHSLYAWKRQLGRQVSGDASKEASTRRRPRVSGMAKPIAALKKRRCRTLPFPASGDRSLKAKRVKPQRLQTVSLRPLSASIPHAHPGAKWRHPAHAWRQK
jgi:transposase-like protein